MGIKLQKYPVTEKMMRNALNDKDVGLFGYGAPVFHKERGMIQGHRMLFTREVTWPGSSEEHPVHMGIYLHGSDRLLSSGLFTAWYIMMGDLRVGDAWMSSESFQYGIARSLRDNSQYLNYEMRWGSDNESVFWDTAFHWPENQHSFMRMVSVCHPPPHELTDTGRSFGGKGVGFGHLVPEIKRTWRIWQEWLVTASVMTLAD